MKRVLMVLVVQGVVFLVGCEKETKEVAGPVATDRLEREATHITAVEREEPKIPDTGRGLVGWWKFDEVSGRRAADSSGHGRNGMLKGGLCFDSNSVPGRIGKAIRFEGGDDYVEIVGYKGITGTRARTVSAWIKTKRESGQLLSWGRDEGGGMFIFSHVRGRIGVTPQGGYLYMKARTNDDAWHHVAAVVEDAELPNLHDHVKIYKDGDIAEIHDIGILDLWPIDTGSERDVRIGSGFEGVIDDVRVYERGLSAEEIELLFAGK